MKNIDDILDKLRKARLISMLELSQAYHQILMDDKSEKLTAFVLPGRGLYQFVRMLYSLINALATFLALMDKLIKPEWEPFVYAYCRLPKGFILTQRKEAGFIWTIVFYSLLSLVTPIDIHMSLPSDLLDGQLRRN